MQLLPTHLGATCVPSTTLTKTKWHFSASLSPSSSSSSEALDNSPLYSSILSAAAVRSGPPKEPRQKIPQQSDRLSSPLSWGVGKFLSLGITVPFRRWSLSRYDKAYNFSISFIDVEWPAIGEFLLQIFIITPTYYFCDCCSGSCYRYLPAAFDNCSSGHQVDGKLK